MKLARVLSVVFFLFISTSGLTQAASSFMQVRNSLWVFGVDNSLTTEVEMVQQGIPQVSFEQGDVAAQGPAEVPEELDLAIAKFES